MVVPLSVAIGDLSNGCTPGSAQAENMNKTAMT